MIHAIAASVLWLSISALGWGWGILAGLGLLFTPANTVMSIPILVGCVMYLAGGSFLWTGLEPSKASVIAYLVGQGTLMLFGREILAGTQLQNATRRTA